VLFNIGNNELKIVLGFVFNQYYLKYLHYMVIVVDVCFYAFENNYRIVFGKPILSGAINILTAVNAMFRRVKYTKS